MAFFFTKEGISQQASQVSKGGVYRIFRARIGFRAQRELYVGQSINIKEDLLELCTGKSAAAECLRKWGADYWECQICENKHDREKLANAWRLKYVPFCNDGGRPSPSRRTPQ